jgi:hypothetical protein
MNDQDKALRRTAVKGVGKVKKAERLDWMHAWDQVVKTNPCGLVLREDGKGQPVIEERKYTKKTGWVIELLSKDTDPMWEFSVFLNLDKAGGLIRFSHTVKWCLDKVQREKDHFTKGKLDKCRARLHNLVTDDIIMVAVLL